MDSSIEGREGKERGGGEEEEEEEEEEDGKRFSRDSWHAASRFVDGRSMETRHFPIPPRRNRALRASVIASHDEARPSN